MSDFEREARHAILAMTDEELADVLLFGRWTTIEIHEAGLRLLAHSGMRFRAREADSEDSQ